MPREAPVMNKVLPLRLRSEVLMGLSPQEVFLSR
jgi:hypothetical protein